MKTKRLISLFMSVVLLVGMFSISFSVFAADSNYAPSGTAYANKNYLEDKAYNGDDLGCTYKPEKTSWKVWSPDATKVQLNLYRTGSDNESGAGVIGSHNMTKTGNCWEISLTGDHKNEYYTYSVTVNGVTKETQDVYSTAVGVNGRRSMVVDLESTNPDGWENDEHVLFDSFGEAAVWEVHVRDFSISKNSGVSEANKGKYLGFAEGGSKLNGVETEISTGIDYLVEQGINCVQLLPIYDFQSVNEEGYSEWGTANRNWGYDPMNYNVPEGSYSSNPHDGNVRITEFKQMIQALHDRGISVIMDVVYNHTFVTEDSSFEKTVPGYYFRKIKVGNREEFSNGSGCGNETASDKAMFRKYMIDSIKYWVDEYHIDGFRFDLMGLHDIPTMNMIRDEVDKMYSDGSGKKIIMYGEPWTGMAATPISNGCIPSRAGQLNPRVGMFGDGFRDAIRGDNNATSKGYIQGDTLKTSAVANGMKAASFAARTPEQQVSYADCHDNYTLWDKIVSSNGSTQYDTTSGMFREQLRLGAGVVFTSQGVVFQLAGTEFARTKYGDGNSYKSSDEVNEHNWSRVKTYATEVNFFKGLREIRSAYSPFTDNTNTSKNTMKFMSSTGNLISYTIENKTANASKEWGKVAVLFNNGTNAVNANLGSSGWTIVSDGTKAGLKSLGTVSGSNYSVPGRTSVILVESSTFNRLSVKEKQFGTLTTEHCDENGKVIRSSTAKYLEGTTFRAIPDKDLLYDNDLFKTEGTVSGKVTANMKSVVKFYYKDNGIESGYLTVNYLNSINSSKVDDSKVLRLRDGDDYQVIPVNIQGVQMDTARYPANTFGVFDGKDKEINFYYKPLESNEIVVNYYNVNDWKTVRCYAYTEDGDEPMGTWVRARPMAANPALGDKWFSITVPSSGCYIMFHNGLGSQEPSQGDTGYTGSGEIWIKDRVVTFNSKIITSHINIETGRKLTNDIIDSRNRVKSTDAYKTSSNSNLGKLIASSTNTEGYCTAGVTNVVYLYESDIKPIEETVILGDVNLDGTVNVVDATLVQKASADIVVLDGNSKISADVNEDGSIDVKDATVIQKYIAGIDTETRAGKEVTVGGTDEPIETDPTTPEETDPTTPTTPTDPQEESVEFIVSDSRRWGTMYAYYWNSETDDKPLEWPGEMLTSFGTNDYGEDQYTVIVPPGYDTIIFTKGDGEPQTVDIIIDRSLTGYYITEDQDEIGSYLVGTW